MSEHRGKEEAVVAVAEVTITLWSDHTYAWRTKGEREERHRLLEALVHVHHEMLIRHVHDHGSPESLAVPDEAVEGPADA